MTRPAHCRCGARQYASEADARRIETDGSKKCPVCYTFARDHAFRGDDASDWRCWDCDVRLFSHGGPS